MTAGTDEQVLTARWLFPANAAPMSRGTITIQGERIVSIDERGARTADIDFGNAAIIPGLVNAHVHLDLSGLRGAIPPGPDFVGWLRGVIASRRGRTPEQTEADIRAGLDECMRSGTTLLGDIAAGGASWDALADARLWAICYREVLGLPAERVRAVWAELGQWVEAHPDTPTCRAGVSPHAPYSVHRTLIEAAARLWPVCIHLAESAAELELLEDHTGPFVRFLQELGVWDADGLSPSFDWILWKTSRAPSALFAHGNLLDGCSRPSTNSTVVYCPRTHAAFGHAQHPFREMLASGTRVALGTDSLASNPNLDLLAEARFLAEKHPDFPGDQLLRMATINGAEALGFADMTGSLEVGKSADLVIAPLPSREGIDPHKLLFADTEGNRQTMWRGSWRH